EALSTRWSPGVRLLPVTDDRCETHVVVTGSTPDATGNGPEADGSGPRAIHFQEWWVKHKAQLPASAFVQIGADAAAPTPETLEAISTADLVVVAPSNPVVSVGAILAVPGIRAALRSTP